MGDRYSKTPLDSEGDIPDKVVPLRPETPKPPSEKLDPRLEELRNILAQSQPIDGAYTDDEVVNDEDKFRKRFGPGFRWSRRDRAGLIALKSRYDLTDSEIRLFHHTGNLHRSVFGVQLNASSWFAMWGGVQLAIFGPILLLLMAATIFGEGAAATVLLKRLIVLLCLSAVCYGIYWVYVKPWRIQRQKQRERDSDV